LRAIAAGATAAVLENKKLKAENQKLSNTNKGIGEDLSKIRIRAKNAEAKIGAN
jgi:hypothetical protein